MRGAKHQLTHLQIIHQLQSAKKEMPKGAQDDQSEIIALNSKQLFLELLSGNREAGGNNEIKSRRQKQHL